MFAFAPFSSSPSFPKLPPLKILFTNARSHGGVIFSRVNTYLLITPSYLFPVVVVVVCAVCRLLVQPKTMVKTIKNLSSTFEYCPMLNTGGLTEKL